MWSITSLLAKLNLWYIELYCLKNLFSTLSESILLLILSVRTMPRYLHWDTLSIISSYSLTEDSETSFLFFFKTIYLDFLALIFRRIFFIDSPNVSINFCNPFKDGAIRTMSSA